MTDKKRFSLFLSLLLSIFCIHAQNTEEIVIIKRFEDNTCDAVKPLYLFTEKEKVLQLQEIANHFFPPYEPGSLVSSPVFLSNVDSEPESMIPLSKTISGYTTHSLTAVHGGHFKNHAHLSLGEYQFTTNSLLQDTSFYADLLFRFPIHPNMKLTIPFSFYFPWQTNNLPLAEETGILFEYQNLHFTSENSFLIRFSSSPSIPLLQLRSENFFWKKNLFSLSNITFSHNQFQIKETVTYRNQHVFAGIESEISGFHQNNRIHFSMDHSLLLSFYPLSGSILSDSSSLTITLSSLSSQSNTDLNAQNFPPADQRDLIKTSMVQDTKNLTLFQKKFFDSYLWKGGIHVEGKIHRVLFGAGTYAVSNSSPFGIRDNSYSFSPPLLGQYVTVGYFTPLFFLKFSPFCITEFTNSLQYGLRSFVNTMNLNRISFTYSNEVQLSQLIENIQIANELKLSYCLINHCILYHLVSFHQNYQIPHREYQMKIKIQIGALVQF